MGRPARAMSTKTTLTLDAKLKERAIVWAVRNDKTLSEMVEEGLRLVLAKGGR
jgi:hypothetical protein